MIVAAFDVGSHTVTCVVMSDDGAVLADTVTVTALAEGLDSTGQLSAEAIARTVTAIRAGRRQAEALGADITAAVITEAGRRAANATDLLDAITDELGTTPSVIDGATEARMTWRGALVGIGTSVDEQLGRGTIGLIDIGGGSTELAVGTDAVAPATAWSMPFGAARLSATELHHDPPRPDELTNAIGLAFDHTDDAAREMAGITHVDVWVGVAGTVVTIAAVEIGLSTWDDAQVHGFRLSRAAVEDVFRTLATESRADRAHNPGLPADRVEVIVGGCCALVAVMRRLQLDEIVVSTRGLAHGLALETLARAAQEKPGQDAPDQDTRDQDTPGQDGPDRVNPAQDTPDPDVPTQHPSGEGTLA